MNKEAEQYIEENIHQYGVPKDVLRAAMEWAYRDSIRVCRETETHSDRHGGDICADGIEARLK